ncbi:polyketide synthase [Archangium sp. Cb G35]|uniref:type I polyketide synthase n=1 Tax=Archangium sp. Cb G35 TaxID=1920190 RepID=UPI000935F120|nr:type I polyketide synthase [Archangium sp. Cb G35]OJT19748.1 polyketide synthase [Archangium sp. Cb G35]
MDNDTLPAGEDTLAVAIIGMAVRVPGASDVDGFWRNLREGVESIRFFSDEELKALGVDPASVHSPSFVKAAPVLDDVGRFDAAFFGYSPREAELMDPQHRLFLECAWKALEHAGEHPTRHPGATGIFAGSSLSTYLLFNLATRPDLVQAEDTFPVMVGNDKDFLATRVAYHLGAKGPAVTVQTGCSTSLVATHLACQALLGFQCDVALAGGVSVHVPQRTGYHHQEGGITSPDGHCRAFDEKGQGTLFGSGLGIVVLKRLEDAIADGNTVHAIIRGSAINNDGAMKVGYTAPGIEGQAEVIARAQAVAEVSPDSISYVEAHGTATQLGDPVEAEALTQAFRAGTQRKGFCGLGSVKTNIGHLDAAAGVAGLIKTTLALEHRELPPSLHFQKPNPRIDFANSPFYVNATLQPWPAGGTPRRAGVSSFGIGGTNAHVVLEEASAPRPGSPARPWQLLPLSAKTPSALESLTASLAAHLKAHPEQDLADVAFTLQVARKEQEYRRVLVCTDREDSLRVLETKDPQRTFSLSPGARPAPVAFLFAGGGAQYVDMGRGLYQSEPAFREVVDRCAELLRPRLGFDPRTAMYPDASKQEEAQQRMKRPSVGLPALFTIEYAMARLWASWGVEPEAMLGHSMGEYVAACLAGVFSLEDALALVVLRGQLFEQLPGGGMLSVPLPEEEVRALLGPELSIAAINGPSQCAIAGTTAAIDALAEELTRREVEFRRIQIDVAAHSHLVEPILPRFQAFVASLKLQAPSVPFVSNVTGTWISPEEATSASYWARHLRHTVRFGEGLRALREQSAERVLLEVGPGRTLSTLAKLQTSGGKPAMALASMRHPQDAQGDAEHLCTTLGRLWLAGVEVDWAKVHQGERRRRVPLPTYPFEGAHYWLQPEAPSTRRRGTAKKSADVASWFHQPTWQRAALRGEAPATAETKQGWLVFLDSGGVGTALCERLAGQGHALTTVQPGPGLGQERQGHYTLEPRRREDYVALLRELKEQGRKVERIVHLWALDAPPDSGPERLDDARVKGFDSLVLLAQALAEVEVPGPVVLDVVGRGALEVESADEGSPEKALALAVCKVIPQENDTVACRYVDLGGPGPRAAGALHRELTVGSREPVVALRGPHRYVQAYEPVRLEKSEAPARVLKQRGVYLVTGGLGGVGLMLAGHLARTYQARLVLVGRTALPPREEWPQWLARDEKDATRRRVRAVQELEAAGAEVWVARADVADEANLRAVVDEAQARFGRLDGVIHAAGLAGQKAVALLSSITPELSEEHFHAKVRGVLALERVVRDRALDFCLLISSNASVLGGLGLTAYAAANGFLDAFASSGAREGHTRWVSTNWDGWPSATDEGPAVRTSIDQFAMSAPEALDAFQRVVESSLSGQVVVSTGDLEARLAQWVRREGASAAGAQTQGTLHARPALGTEYVAPGSELEGTLVRIWQETLGLEQLGVHDNFFDLGGSSLIWLKVVGRLKKELGREVPLTSVFEAPSVAALAKLLGEGPAEPQTYDAQQSRGAARRERRNRRG